MKHHGKSLHHCGLAVAASWCAVCLGGKRVFGPTPGDRRDRTVLPTIGRWLTALSAIALPIPGNAQAQVGLSSGVGQVTLVARSSPRASLHSVGPIVEIGRRGALKEATVGLRLSANSAYRLRVHRTSGHSRSRLWVHAVDGSYHELRAGSPVTVGRSSHASGDSESTVRYWLESPARGRATVLPVRYEIVVEPTI